LRHPVVRACRVSAVERFQSLAGSIIRAAAGIPPTGSLGGNRMVFRLLYYFSYYVETNLKLVYQICMHPS
jgi:hypothetical protein